MSKMTKVIAALGVVAGLGVAAMPLSSYADSKNAQVDVYASVNSALAITAETSSVDLGEIALGSMVTTPDPVKVTVSTNAAAYKLSIQGLNGETDMYKVGEFDVKLTGEDAATIPAGDLTGTESSWGYQVDGEAGFKAIPAGITEIGEGTGTEDGGTRGSHNVKFGVRVSDTQAQGRYKGSVVFIATVNE